MIKCRGCGKQPHEIAEYRYAAIGENVTPEDYVKQEEGTYDPRTDQFLCTDCDVKAGTPVRII